MREPTASYRIIGQHQERICEGIRPMLTLSLVDRLLASKLVPPDAKLAAIESWRTELATTRNRDSVHRQLEQRLALASRQLNAVQPGFARLAAGG